MQIDNLHEISNLFSGKKFNMLSTESFTWHVKWCHSDFFLNMKCEALFLLNKKKKKKNVIYSNFAWQFKG